MKRQFALSVDFCEECKIPQTTKSPLKCLCWALPLPQLVSLGHSRGLGDHGAQGTGFRLHGAGALLCSAVRLHDCLSQLSCSCQWPSTPNRPVLPVITIHDWRNTSKGALSCIISGCSKKPDCYWFGKLLLLRRWGLVVTSPCPLVPRSCGRQRKSDSMGSVSSAAKLALYLSLLLCMPFTKMCAWFAHSPY